MASITDNGTGDYTITWDTDFANANYAVAGAANKAGAANVTVGLQGIQTGATRIQVWDTGNTMRDSDICTVMTIGDQ